MEGKEQKRRDDNNDDGLVRLEIKVRNTLHLFVLCKAPPQPICVARQYRWMDVGYSRECCRQSNTRAVSAIGGGNNKYRTENEPTGAAGWSWRAAGVHTCFPTVKGAKAGS